MAVKPAAPAPIIITSYFIPVCNGELVDHFLPILVRSQMIKPTTTTTDKMPTHTPALKIPSIAEQLLKKNRRNETIAIIFIK
jgi:hypothetical protein